MQLTFTVEYNLVAFLGLQVTRQDVAYSRESHFQTGQADQQQSGYIGNQKLGSRNRYPSYEETATGLKIWNWAILVAIPISPTEIKSSEYLEDFFHMILPYGPFFEIRF